MAESILPNRSVEFMVAVLVLMSLATALYVRLGVPLTELTHRLLDSAGGLLPPGS